MLVVDPAMLLAELQRGSSTCIFAPSHVTLGHVEFQGSFECLFLLHNDFNLKR